jgi:hypothetical protein
VLSFSIATTDERHREVFEPGAAPLAERWRLLRAARALGLATGVMAMPVLPGLSDTPDAVQALVQRAREVGADFICYGGLTLRPGIQKDGFFAVLERNHPELVAGYRKLFQSDRASGVPDPRYSERLEGRFRAALALYPMPARMPQSVFHGLIPLYTEVAVLLEHRGWQLGEAMGGQGPLARAGWAIAEWARARLAPQRGRDAYRLVESEFALLVRSRQLHEISELRPEAFADVDACFAKACALPTGR